MFAPLLKSLASFLLSSFGSSECKASLLCFVEERTFDVNEGFIRLNCSIGYGFTDKDTHDDNVTPLKSLQLLVLLELLLVVNIIAWLAICLIPSMNLVFTMLDVMFIWLVSRYQCLFV